MSLFAPAERTPVHDTQAIGHQEVSLRLLSAAALFLLALWLFDYFVLHTPILTTLATDEGNLRALTPLYAFWVPEIRPAAIIFPLLAGVIVACSSFVQDEKRVSSGTFALYLFVAFCGLAAALFLVRSDLSTLAQNLTIYPDEEVYFDSRRMGSIGDFIRNYKNLQPQLSMRGQHYPPGGAIVLHMIALLFGGGLLKVGVAALTMAGAGVSICYAAMRKLLSEDRARQAALLLAASPSLLDFSCTSMDAIFFFSTSLCLFFSFAVAARQNGATTPNRSALGLAFLSGISLYLACLLSFAGFTLGACLLLFIMLNGWKRMKLTLTLIGAAAMGFISLELLFRSGFSYSLLENLSYAREHNVRFMSSVLGRPMSELYFYACYGNISAFLIGCGAGVTGATFGALRSGSFSRHPWTMAAAATLFIMTVGGMYILETERIWLFAIPWLAMIAVGMRPFSSSSFRLLTAAGLIQAFVMEILLFTLW